MMDGNGRSGRNGDGGGDGRGIEEEVEKLISGLRLTEGEKAGVRLRRRKEQGGADAGELCLVGKLLTRKHFNVEAMVKTLTMVWRPSKGLDYKLLEGNLILFQFYDGDDMIRVVKEGPWSFDGHALILKKFEGDKRPTDIAFDKLSLWVRIYNLPLNCMTKEEGFLLGATVGEVEEVEVDKEGKAWGRFMRVRVKVDVTAPLPRGVMLYLEEGSERGMWCRAAYEKLPNYCYHCGKLDHLDKDCQVPIAPGQKMQYGAWLRVSPVRRKGWGANKAGDHNHTPSRSGRAKGPVQSKLLERLDKVAESENWETEISRGRQCGSQREDAEEGSTSMGRKDVVKEKALEEVATSEGGKTEDNSGLVTKEEQLGTERSLGWKSGINASANSGMEVTSPHKKRGQGKGAPQEGKGKEKVVRRKYKTKPKGGGEQGKEKGTETSKIVIAETVGQGKRKEREDGAEGIDSVEGRRKLKEKKGRWIQQEEQANDIDMLLVDLVGAEAQPHQEKCI